MSAIETLAKYVSSSGLTSDKEMANAARAELAALREAVQSEAESVAEFNAGFDACKAGMPYDSEPENTKHDQWRVGWAWAAFDALRADAAINSSTQLLRETITRQEQRITELEQAVSEARELLTQPQGADWDEQVEAWLAYYAEKEK